MFMQFPGPASVVQRGMCKQLEARQVCCRAPPLEGAWVNCALKGFPCVACWEGGRGGRVPMCGMVGGRAIPASSAGSGQARAAFGAFMDVLPHALQQQVPPARTTAKEAKAGPCHATVEATCTTCHSSTQGAAAAHASVMSTMNHTSTTHRNLATSPVYHHSSTRTAPLSLALHACPNRTSAMRAMNHASVSF